MRWWRDAAGDKTHVELRLTIDWEELVRADFMPIDKEILRVADSPDASMADRLLALEVLVRAKEKRTYSIPREFTNYDPDR